MARRIAGAVIAALLLARSGLGVGPLRSAAEQAKIDFLLQEVKKSDDVFIRNGREFSGPRASGHLATKLRFAGNRVQTATDFILESLRSPRRAESCTRSGRARDTASRFATGCSRGCSSMSRRARLRPRPVRHSSPLTARSPSLPETLSFARLKSSAKELL